MLKAGGWDGKMANPIYVSCQYHMCIYSKTT